MTRTMYQVSMKQGIGPVAAAKKGEKEFNEFQFYQTVFLPLQVP